MALVPCHHIFMSRVCLGALLLALVPRHHIVIGELATKDVERAAHRDVNTALARDPDALQVLLQEKVQHGVWACLGRTCESVPVMLCAAHRDVHAAPA